MDPDALDVVLNRATSEPDLVMSGDSGIMEEEEDEELPPSIFDRKGFGELAFFRHRPPQVVQESAFKDALLSLPVGEEEEEVGATGLALNEDGAPASATRSETWVEGLGSCKVSNDELTSLRCIMQEFVDSRHGRCLVPRLKSSPICPSIYHQMSVSSGGDVGLPWDVDALLEDLDDDVNDIGTNTPLEAFLAAHGLKNFLGILAAEKIDLESLCLCR